MNLDEFDYLFIARRDKYDNSESFSKNIMIGYFKMLEDEIQIKKTLYGKPYVSCKGFHYNISHNEKWIIMGISNNVIGVDIEKKQKISDKIKDQILKDIRKWTIYESYIKAIGKGMAIEPYEIQITNTSNNNGTIKTNKYPIFFYTTYDEMIKDSIITISRSDNKKKIKVYKI